MVPDPAKKSKPEKSPRVVDDLEPPRVFFAVRGQKKERVSRVDRKTNKKERACGQDMLQTLNPDLDRSFEFRSISSP